MAKLFEYCVIYHPKTIKDAAGNDTTPKDELVVKVTHVLSNNEKEVAMVAARAIPDTHIDKLDQLEICVRPF